jgi:AcrR family transcriptional regulator
MIKTKIIDTAFRVWGRNFYQKTSLSQLAGELKVSKTALYRHFTNKQALTDAMTVRFFDDFAAAVRADFEKALEIANPDEGIFIIVQSITGYFAQNVYALIFSLINIYYRNAGDEIISEHLKRRGADMSTLYLEKKKKYDVHPAVLKLIFATLSFYLAHFHKINKSLENPPSDEKIKNIISSIYKLIENGLGFSAEKINAIDFEKLEKQIEGMTLSAEPEPLFKAVAEVVAEAGPWDASMEMVAKRIGFSKSSLYGHFKNRKDMLTRLFLSEFTRIIEFARQGIKLSTDTAEQLYLGIYSITVYLRSRPEILVAIGWIRTRKLDLGKPKKQTEIFRLFEDVEIESLLNAAEEEKQLASHWILFMLVNTLSRPYKSEKEETSGENNDIHVLYKYITSGLGGFIR